MAKSPASIPASESISLRSNGARRGRRGAVKAKSKIKLKPSPASVPMVHYASVFPNPRLGPPLPPEFVTLVRQLEGELKMPVWMLIQNGATDYCCSSICLHSLRGFQSQRSEIPL